MMAVLRIILYFMELKDVHLLSVPSDGSSTLSNAQHLILLRGQVIKLARSMLIDRISARKWGHSEICGLH
jgi:hypothetical protein